MNEAEVVERMTLVADHQAAEVPQPSEQALDLPAAAVSTQPPAVLRLGTRAVAPVGSDHLDAQRCERGIERIGIVGAICDEALGQISYEAGVERGGDKRNLVRRS